MSFIEVNVDEVEEDKIAPEAIYPMLIVGTKFIEEKSLIQVILSIEDDENYANVFHNIALPKPDDDAGKIRFKMLFTKRFLSQFDIPSDGGIETEAFVGCRADVNLKQEEYNGQFKNVLVLNRLPVE
jgi:hypothetical protein